MANFARLLSEARPGAEWTLTEVNDYSTLIWFRSNPERPPTERELLDTEEAFETLREDREHARRSLSAAGNRVVREELAKAEDSEQFADDVAERLRQDNPTRSDRALSVNQIRAIEDTKRGGPPPDPRDPRGPDPGGGNR